MTQTMRISELAARSGFAASALRYYEQVGLLSAADRTSAGYRLYDEPAVRRLKFIDRAKQLGLPLSDIKELVAGWDEGQCVHVRAALRAHIASRYGEVQQRIADLSGFAAQLSAADAELSGTAPDGPCGPGCGCSDPPALPADSAPVVCTLEAEAVQGRRQEWSELVVLANGVEQLDDGVRLDFDPDLGLVARLATLAVLEQTCCSFLTFTIHPAAESVTLEVRGPVEAREVISGMVRLPATS